MTQLTKQDDAMPAVTQQDQTMQLLQQAVQSGTSPEALEKLVALQERILDRNAEAAYTAAMAQFQARCPTIEKKHVVKDRGGRILYRYAPLEDIVAQIRPLMAELGFSYSFDTEQSETGVHVECTVRHREGHKSTSRVYIPATTGHNTNASQNMGIQLAYGKRYALTGAFGITTADEDQDGQVQALRHVTAGQAKELEEMADSIGAEKDKVLRYANADAFTSILIQDYERVKAALQAKGAK